MKLNPRGRRRKLTIVRKRLCLHSELKTCDAISHLAVDLFLFEKSTAYGSC